MTVMEEYEIESTEELTDPFDLGTLTAGDKLWLWRQRQPSRRSLSQNRGHGRLKQADAAELLGIFSTEERVNSALYRFIESGYGTVLQNRAALAALASLDSSTRLDRWTSGELCALARRRSKLSIAEASRELGYSKPMYYRFEASGDEKIKRLWKARGYRFP
jgi:hypothetical protein